MLDACSLQERVWQRCFTPCSIAPRVRFLNCTELAAIGKGHMEGKYDALDDRHGTHRGVGRGGNGTAVRTQRGSSSSASPTRRACGGGGVLRRSAGSESNRSSGAVFGLESASQFWCNGDMIILDGSVRTDPRKASLGEEKEIEAQEQVGEETPLNKEDELSAFDR